MAEHFSSEYREFAHQRAASLGLTRDGDIDRLVEIMERLRDPLHDDTKHRDVLLTLLHGQKSVEERLDRALRLAASRSHPGERPRAGAHSKRKSESDAAPLPRDAKKTRSVIPRAQAVTVVQAVDPGEIDPQSIELEGYRIDGKIGGGGMGVVYKGYDINLQIPVAIKLLLRSTDHSETQFLEEARAASSVRHSNIVQVLQYRQIGNRGVYIMEYVEGRDCGALIPDLARNVVHEASIKKILKAFGIQRLAKLPGGLPQGAYHVLLALWLAEVADGLDIAHRRGIAHRDIKPSNLIMSTDGVLKLTDFGLARRSRQAPGVMGSCSGTPAYLAPERIAAWAARDESRCDSCLADIWSLGATMYELLTYRPCYDQVGLFEVLSAIATTDPMPPRQIVWSIPEPLEAICLKAMARQPDERYLHVSEFAHALRDWVRHEEQMIPVTKQSGVLNWVRGRLARDPDSDTWF